ncbi:hypothetical protein [Paenibacillus sp. FSL P4-0288]|uniref:hypothetical protein n=1 Tax=Paenibacillus sp. FSL P4-0288 TaxID=2921633 RepID=UPI0030FC1940
MYKVNFNVDTNDKADRKEPFLLRFIIEYKSELFQTFVTRYLEDKIGRTYVIISRSLFKTNVIVTQAVDIFDSHKTVLGKGVLTTKENARKLHGSNSAPFILLKEGSYTQLQLTEENLIYLQSKRELSNIIQEINLALTELLQPLNDHYSMQAALLSLKDIAQ